MSQTRCFSCGAKILSMDGTVHRYMSSSPGCWAMYGEVLAREYTDYAYAINHRMTVDAYAIQHPSNRAPQNVRSVAIHLSRLCLIFENDVSITEAARLMQNLASHKSAYPWLEPPENLGQITVRDVFDANDPQTHVCLVEKWARTAWEAWSRHHTQVRQWIASYAYTQRNLIKR